ncbi:PREDICTED: uncharacterized protein LOC109580417 isoform X2 [Amphimedon queenslandica]|uniref:Uncharacterized protein n=1 Tax=Amphimedon queenslandica TaxID=400682 RepID=A0AAN0IW99_AMPQE|nr:PREDICTED: uncharacterized protein LOC109580417 isoform X2 [Amphimedon queenslandica]|eukprot:XP_019849065.1 PREDICTED: uncharacterized protein LOC109580417 isoform X2 [Amphimedon queenslandica]
MASGEENAFVSSTKELKVLRRNASKLQRTISDHRLLSMDLYSAELISLTTLQKVNVPVTTPDAQSYEIINNLIRAVVVDPDNFHKLLQVLEDHPPLLTAVAKEMKEEYDSCEFECTSPLKQPEISNDQQKKIITIDGRTIQRGYDRMRGKLAELVFDFQKVVEKSTVNIEDLKQYVILYHPDEQYRDELRKARDINAVFAVIRSKFCSLFNYTVLLRIAEKFNLPDGFEVIQRYEAEEENYRRILSSSALADELQKENELLHQNLSHTKAIILRLQRWSRPPALTVDEFHEVIKDIFADLGDLLHLLKVEAGSIIITMCAPERVTGTLIALAKRKIAYLKDIGVTWLTIGNTLIINDIEDTEELSHDVMEQEIEDKPSSPSPIKENSSDNVNQLPITGTVSQLSRPTVQAVADDGGDDTDQGMGTDSATPIYTPTWRNYPFTPREVMIIGSFGDHNNWLEQQSIVSPKILTKELSDEWRKEETEKIADLYSKNPEKYHIKSVHYNIPGEERTKEYYIEAIKKFFINCTQPGANIDYTGHGEKDTGNWCFKDGVISFNDIFELYINYFKGKSLSITSDCSYSGNWINECGKRLDEMNVPSCGHHTRQQGLLFKISTSCEPNEEATALCYVNEANAYSEADKTVVLWYGKTLTSGQKTMLNDFRDIRCSKPANESCEADTDCTWNDYLSNKYHLVYKVCGKDKGYAAWHYVLVDEEKFVDFKAQVATGSIDLSKYGKILESGWGKDPPEDIERKVNLRFGKLLKPL